ncbi:MAG: metalloprotease TldD, partial [Alphaproteobacteria bacterium GM202ARS2]|nr:metalloprotease TldD [Alphaproteobacteria bacterium GM202ARS2]
MKEALAVTDRLFFDGALSREQAESSVASSLRGCDDGDLFLEHCVSERFVWDDGRLKDSSRDVQRGFGLRGLHGEASALGYGSAIDEGALKRAASFVVEALPHAAGRNQTMALSPEGTEKVYYGADNPLESLDAQGKIAVLQEIDRYVRSLEPMVCQVMVMVHGIWQAVQVVRADGFRCADLRPLVRLNVQVTVAKGERRESGVYGMGGRGSYGMCLQKATWQRVAQQALKQAVINLDAKPAPVGEMDVVLGPGWPGILLHEAIGHGLEGDFNRKNTSAFSGLLGQRIAAPGVTIVDDGTCVDARGSLNMDDEGTPCQCTTLIEDGILVGYMQDRLNGRLMAGASTGNGRRQSYAHGVMPRMTNTYMLNGKHDPQALIESVDDGLYAINFGGGQVDITSGKFVFSASLAYRIEKGRLTYPVTGATLIGNGADALTRISMVGNDMALD